MDHGLRRRLQRLTTTAGHFCVAAIDHRDSLVAEFADHGDGTEPSPEVLTRFKSDVITALGDRPSAVMIEPEFSFPHLTDTGLVDRGVGVICALESQGYLSKPELGNELMPGWTPRRLMESGADGAKLFALYRHDDPDLAPQQERLIRQVVEDCAALQLPVLVEPIPYRLADASDRRESILGAAERLRSFGPMILKMPYPGEGACHLLNEACGDQPWALLSWGVGFDEFVGQLTEAVAAGCNGFMVGRALWREALPVSARHEVLATTVLDRFDRLCTITTGATPWHAKFGPPTLDDWPWAR
jgi:tagatose 1,6-diphosphate aldolase